MTINQQWYIIQQLTLNIIFMTTKLFSNENMTTSGEKLQQDVNIILEDFLDCVKNNNDLFECHFDVDTILKLKIPSISSDATNNKIYNKNSRNLETHTSRRIDSKMNPIDPRFYEKNTTSKKSSFFKNTIGNIFGIA